MTVRSLTGVELVAWLGGIIVNLLLIGDYYDIARCDVGLLVGALTLARLATAFPPAAGRDARLTPTGPGVGSG